MINYRSYDDLSRVIYDNLPDIAKEKFDLIAGVPRSGMIPAYMIALGLNLPVCSVDDLFKNKKSNLHHGNRRLRSSVVNPLDSKKILIVEDSYYVGNRLKETLSKIDKRIIDKCKTLVVYAISDDIPVDFSLEVIPQPRVFEWNVLNHPGIIPQSAFDMDGVLCEDPTSEANDDGSRYIEFIKNAKPKFIPMYTIKAIVTSRLEKYRPETEAWLKKWNVKYEKLIMLKGYSAEERARLGIHGQVKAQEYIKGKYELFFESNIAQAQKIANLSKKQVFCVDDMKMISPIKINQTENKVHSKIIDSVKYLKHKTRVRTRIKNLAKKVVK